MLHDIDLVREQLIVPIIIVTLYQEQADYSDIFVAYKLELINKQTYLWQ